MLRFATSILLIFAFPAMASAPSEPKQYTYSPKAAAVFLLARKEMPLPVIEVKTLPLRGGKWLFVIEMSAAGQAWAKKPTMHVTFEIPDEGGPDLIEQAMHEASAYAKAFIEDEKKNSAIQEVQWP